MWRRMHRIISTITLISFLTIILLDSFHLAKGAALKEKEKVNKKKTNNDINDSNGFPPVLPVPVLQPGYHDSNGSRRDKTVKNYRFHFNSTQESLVDSAPKSYKKVTIDKVGMINKLSTLIPLPMDEVQPPDHMDGVRVEQDGDLNLKYRKEILLGDHNEFDLNIDNKVEAKIKEVFYKADKIKDDYLNLDELNDWMTKMVKEHLEEAEKENEEVFDHIDIDKDGNVTWTEFSIHFLLAKGYSLEKAVHLSTNEVYNDVAITPEEKEKLIRYKFRWAESDEGLVDGQLDKNEMMNFRHPEQSPSMIKRVALDLLENFDANEDNKITEDEFVNIPSRYVGDTITDDQKEQRRQEFKIFIDLDKDGVVGMEELKLYVDPRNLQRLRSEAENLILMADEDSDHRLSLKEILENSELFLGSKLVDASRNFHDEF